MAPIRPYVHENSGPEQVTFGIAAAPAIRDWIEQRGLARVVLLTSPSVSRTATCGAIVDMLGERHRGTYAGMRPHSPRECALEAAELARRERAEVMVCVGGGSVIDAAKVAQLCLWQGFRSDRDLQAYRDAGSPDPAGAGDGAVRTIAVPTTLSAAEFNPLAGVTNSATGQKETYHHRLFVPAMVVLDPAALADSPPEIVLSTGIRTIDHCVETFCSTAARPFSDALSVAALKLLLRHLPEVRHGIASPYSYLQLLTAAWMAISGPISGVPVGASHGIGRVLGAVANVAHGHTSAVLLPAVLAWNAQDPVAADRQRQLLAALGLGGDGLADVIDKAIADLGQPRTLSAAGMDRKHFAAVSRFGLEMLGHPSTSGNARPITSERQIEEILEAAW